MKFIYCIIWAIVTALLIFILNTQLPVGGGKKTPVLGFFLHPQKGFWQNAESVAANFDGEVKVKGLTGKADVYFDERLVPHVYAENTKDAYFLQGYLHAKFRLFQMEFQTHIAGGRLSEIIGTKGLAIDKYFRRLGMNYAAENALRYMEDDLDTKLQLDAYTAGANAYINSLDPKDYPFEYKLLNYKPEPWTNLKTALFLKLMSYDLSGQNDDLLYQNAKTFFGFADYSKLFADMQDNLSPIIPTGTAFESNSITPKKPFNYDSGYILQRDTFTVPRVYTPNKNNGSNNWAVDSSLTASKRPILCNDPHLNLNLPSLWYEIQITTPTYSTYGASFPGSPAVIIGFNDSIAWGVTNSGRDVKDYYEVQFKDSTMKEYWFNGDWVAADIRTEKIKIKDSVEVIEKVAYTEHGPVMFDKKYKSKNDNGKYYAVRWTAHDPSAELLTFIKLNKAHNFNDYREAIAHFECPGQNFVFAAKTGDVAITQQGKFPAKWKHQGDFVMNGDDSTYMWQGYIPFNENPFIHNPANGFVSSANQKATDSSYKYYLGKADNFPVYRGLIINRLLGEMHDITVQDMQQLQTNNYNVFAELARPILINNIDRSGLTTTANKYINALDGWNLYNNVNEKGATIFQVWWDSLEHTILDDDYEQSRLQMPWPSDQAFYDAINKDSSFRFYDNIYTITKKETLKDCVTNAFKKALKTFESIEKSNTLTWGAFKATRVNHLLKDASLSKLNVISGGNVNCINATKENHGPSWRMIVHLTDDIEAYGVYPGGQSGNPGSFYYDNFIDTWGKGQYNKLLFIPKKLVANNKLLKWHMKFGV